MTMDGSPPASGSFPQIAASLAGEVLDGRYRLVKKLGEGGMGEVYAAEHVHIEKRFAVKLLRQEIVSNKEAVSRFRQEARSASSIGHRNIIAIEDFGQLPDGRIYMCMELLDGAPLNDLIKQPLSMERLVNILIQTGHGLAAAHAKNIVHRDMKPENVFVTFAASGEDIPKLLDFGIAKVAGNEGQNNLTRTGTIFGTPYYMAPEQALGTQVDQRTDIYAMGVIMYEVFSGSLPFQGESFMGILTQHITTEPESILARAAKAGRMPLPPGVPEIVHRCLQKEPANRFQSMDELVAALISVYRAVAGAGMSSYMEAFPQSSASSSSPVKFTPPPSSLGGPMAIGTGHPGPGQSQPIGMPHGTPMGPPMGPPPGGYMSGGHPGVSAAGRAVSQTGPYGSYDPGGSAVIPERKSKVGIIFAIIAVLAVVGGGVGFIVIGSKKTNRADAGPTDAGTVVSDAAVAVADAGVAPADGRIVPPADAGVMPPADAGTTAADAGVTPPADAGVTPPADAGVPATDAGGIEPDAGGKPDAGTTPIPQITEIEVVFSVTPASARLYEGSRQLSSLRVKVSSKKAKKITIKASGYKSKTVTVNGRDDRMSVALEKEPEEPPPLDCRSKLVDRSNKACLAQFCKTHGAEMECTE